MSQNSVRCENCGNEWETRKPLDEIERLRCSDCGMGPDQIEVIEADTTEESEEGEELSVVDRIKLQERHTKLRNRAETVMRKIEQVGGGSVPDDLEPLHDSLTLRSKELSSDDLLPAAELDDAAEYIAEKETEIESHDLVEEVTDLELRVEELEAEIEALEEEKERIEKYIAMGPDIDDGS